MVEICKRHNVDHTGTYCGLCVELWKRHSLELKKLRAKNRLLEKELRSSKELYDFVMKKRISERKELEFLRKTQGFRTTKDET